MPRKTKRRTMFFQAKHPSIAEKISIVSPSSFRESIRTLKKGGLSLNEYRSLVLAQNRARAMLNRENLSAKERKQLRIISKIKIPSWRTN
jgi:hypothetical protein